MKSRHLKIITVFAVIIILSLLHNLKALHKGLQRYDRKAPDAIAAYEKRFGELKTVLKDHAVVGYISDIDVESVRYGQAYNMTQYVLAPTILIRGIKRKIIIGNFQDAQPDIKAYAKERLSLINDFGNGVLVFERMDH